jgi:hypothetical protein
MNKLKKDSPNKWVMEAVMIAATIYNVVSGISNNKKRKDSLAKAQELDNQLQGQMDAMRDYDFRVQNPYEDIDVTTKAQEVAANQQTQQAADILANLAPVAGAGATAALATSIAKQGSAAAAKLQGRMAQQEFQLQQRAAGAQLAIDRGVKQQEFNRDAALMNMQMYRAAGEYAQAAQFGQAAQDNFTSAVETGTYAAQGLDDKITKTTTTERQTDNTINSQNEVNIDRSQGFFGELYNDQPTFNIPEDQQPATYTVENYNYEPVTSFDGAFNQP